MYDYLIIGHGLAGAILSRELLDKGKKVLVFNEPSLNSASLVAGGLYNPITGRKMVKTWNADNTFPLIEPYYRSFEQKLGVKTLYDIGIYRPFLNVEEQNEWQGKAALDSYSPYVEKVYLSSRRQFKLNDEFGGIQLKQAGYVDTNALINANKKLLVSKGIYQELMFNESELENSVESMTFRSFKFRNLIYSNGYNSVKDWCFDWLPFSPVKGEILRLNIDNKKIDSILNRWLFLLPVAGNKFRAGATYNWREVNNEPSQQGQEEIENKLQILYKGDYKIVGCDAGIRPATKDRRPFIGLHPENNKIGIFNGFGSKGVSLIPYYAKMFVNHLERDMPLDKEVNVSRYFSLS